MRGKNKIWKTIAALFIVSIAISSFNIVKVYANTPTVYIDNPASPVPSPEFGPKIIGQKFWLDVKVWDPDDPEGMGWVYGVRGYELILTWNQKMLKLLGPDGTRELGALLEGPFLKMEGRKTFPVAAKSIAGDSVVFTDLITFPVPDSQSGADILASMQFEVIGGGECNITLSARLFDIDFNDFPAVDTYGGHFFSPDPYISFKWIVPVAEELPPQDNATVRGMNMGIVVDPDGDIGHVSTTPYETERPVLSLTDDGVPEKVNMVEGGTMFYGDKIIFDASESYDLDITGHRVELDPNKFKWVIKAGGLDTFTKSGKTYDFRYESAFSAANGSIVFKGDDDIGTVLVFFNTSELHAENIEENGLYDPGEFIYRDVDASGTVSVNDTRLTDVAINATFGYKNGSIVKAGDLDVGTLLVAFTNNELHEENIAENGVYDPGETIHIGGKVSIGDKRLTDVEKPGELARGPTISYTFPGALPATYTYYGSSHLGFHLLIVTVTDSDGNSATFSTWIRIYRIAPARTININIPNPKHSLKKDGIQMILNGRVQNRAGTGWWPWDVLLIYLELARIIHPFVWARMRFDILDLDMNPVTDGTVYSDAIWLRATEQPVGFMSATWTIPEGLSPGTYYVKGTGQICGSGVTYGLKVGSFLKPIEILP